MYEAEYHLAVELVREASRLARSAQDEISAARDRVVKADRSPVTIADLAVQAVVASRLAEATPQVPLMAEEDAQALHRHAELAGRVLDLARHAFAGLDEDGLVGALASGGHSGGRQGRFWCLDPIDGTKGFLRGEQFAVALALVEDGRVVVGVVGCPNLPMSGLTGEPRGCLVSAVRGGGASLEPLLAGGEARRVGVDGVADPARARFCESVESGHSSHGASARVAERLGITAEPVRLDSQAKYAVVARGEAEIYLRLPTRADYREKLWDHAAGSLVVEEAGGAVSDGRGRPLDFGAGRTLSPTDGIVVSNGAIHRAVLATLAELREG